MFQEIGVQEPIKDIYHIFDIEENNQLQRLMVVIIIVILLEEVGCRKEPTLGITGSENFWLGMRRS
jgi:hypothetical protein